MAPRIGGIAYLKVDGRQLNLRGNFSVSPSATEKQMIVGQDGPHGYIENPRVQYIEGDISLPGDLELVDLEAINGNTVTAELANGRVFVVPDAVCTAAFVINTHDGSTHVRFEAGPNGGAAGVVGFQS